MDKNHLEISYWKFFNRSARIVGGLLCGAGILIGSYNFLLVLYPDINVNNSAGVDPFDKWISVIFPVMIAVLGFLVTRSKPYFPPHIMKYMSEKKEDD